MGEFKPSTIEKLKEIYNNSPELIDYLIKFGNVYERAQATLIKSVAVDDLQVPDCLVASDTRKLLFVHTSEINGK